jgi:hypothetical protein
MTFAPRLALALSLLPALATPSLAAPSGAAARREVGGGHVATLAGGDLVMPRFSPDGDTLAYVRVTVDEDVELDEVLLYDVASGRDAILLDARAAREYAVYAAVVWDMRWFAANRLRVEVSDGDVDSTVLLFDTSARKLVSSRASAGDEDGDFSPERRLAALPADARAARSRALAVFPSLAPEALDSAIDMSRVVVAGGRLVFQKNYAGADDDVRLLDLGARTERVLVAGGGVTLRGGCAWGGSILLFVSTGSATDAVVVDAHGEARDLGAVATTDQPYDVRVVRRSASGVVVFVRGLGQPDRADNALVVFDGSGVVVASDYDEVADADVDAAGRRVAFGVWGDGTRRIVVRDLLP